MGSTHVSELDEGSPALSEPILCLHACGGRDLVTLDQPRPKTQLRMCFCRFACICAFANKPYKRKFAYSFLSSARSKAAGIVVVINNH